LITAGKNHGLRANPDNGDLMIFFDDTSFQSIARFDNNGDKPDRIHSQVKYD
jgi:hypothetical protein